MAAAKTSVVAAPTKLAVEAGVARRALAAASVHTDASVLAGTLLCTHRARARERERV